MSRIVVVGSLNLDLIAFTPRLPGAGETLLGRGFAQAEGGKGANQAYAAARLGGDVAMLGRVGNDEAGRRMRDNLNSAGCDTSGVAALDTPSGVALIFVADQGHNAIVVAPGANGAYSPREFAADAASLAGAEIVLLQLETPMETVIAAARAARAMGARVILDPAPAPAALPEALLGLVDVLTPNESEAARLAGRRAIDLSVPEAAEIAEQLRAQGARTVVVKLGGKGCLVAEEGRSTWVPCPVAQAVDATAAGDVFNAALAVACCEGAVLVDACRFAVSAASLSVTRAGAQPSAPGREEADAWARIHPAPPPEVLGVPA